MGTRRRSGCSGRPRGGGGAANGAVRRGPQAHWPAARLRPRSSLAPPETRAALRRRAYRVVSVLFAAGGRASTPVVPVPPRRRLARVLVACVLARVPRSARRAHRLVGSAAVSANPAAGVLLLAALRATTARGRRSRRGRRARGPVRAAGCARAATGRAGGRLRGKAYPGEAARRARPRPRPGARGDSRVAWRDLRRRP